MSNLFELYTNDYLEKVFYFCLKKTGSSHEAEDLTQDISLCIILELNKGRIPVHFSAWVWQIAKNRYSVWADNKHKRSEFVSGIDIADFELADDTLIENELIHGEDLSLLRRELAFISSDYRNIVVAFYIDDIKAKDIALRLNLPESTVRSKLLRARNILLQASDNPSTVEELSMELGIVAPYMEEEIQLLINATLLKKVGDKYVTNFYIVNRECQLKMYMAQRQNSKERSELTDKIADDTISVIRSNGIIRNNMTDSEIKWWLIIHIIDFCVENIKGYTIHYPEKRDNGETWGFIGYEKLELPENCVMGHNGCGNNKNMFWTYKIGGDLGMWNRAGDMGYNQTLLLGDIIRNKRNFNALTESEKAVGIDTRFVHIAENGEIIPDILVFENDTLSKSDDSIKQHYLFESLKNNISEAFNETIEILKENSTEILHGILSYCASMQILDIRMMTLHDEVATGKLIVPDDPSHSNIAMWIEVR